MVRKRFTVAVIGLGGASAAQRSEVSRHRRERDALAAASDERDRLAITYGAAARNYRIVVEADGEIAHEVRLDGVELPDDMVTVIGPAGQDARPDRDAAPGGDPSDDNLEPALEAPFTADEPRESTAEHPLITAGADDLWAAAPADDAPPADDGETEPDDGIEPAAETPSARPGADHDTDVPEPSSPHPTVDEETDMFDTARASFSTRDDRSARRPAMPTWDDVPSGPVPAEVLRYFESAVAREEARLASRRRDELDVA
ncbi:MAG: hypothetical protein KDC33_06475 [Thermoleophilia bacterium]|nr:hypothetical protein [Thermoleophilia bacterium]